MPWRLRHPNKEDPTHPGETLVLEAQLFLDGEYLDIAFSRDRDIPVWVWLSVLAHGKVESLERATYWLHGDAGARPEFDTWGRLLEHMARQVLETASTGRCSLGEIQRKLLIPLELTIIATPVGPTTLYRLINSMLSEMRAKIEAE